MTYLDEENCFDFSYHVVSSMPEFILHDFSVGFSVGLLAARTYLEVSIIYLRTSYRRPDVD